VSYSSAKNGNSKTSSVGCAAQRAIFGGQNTFERDVKCVEKLVQVGGLVQRGERISEMTDAADSMPVKIGNVQAVQKKSLLRWDRKAAAGR